jgi:serine/threonine protein kinase/CheY-like chemotaxis protein/DNA-binding MarR family transcriptional regulator
MMALGPDPLLGRVIAERYEILSLINVGGMGLVYRATQRSLDRPVAIKFIHPHLLVSESSVQRFMEEARAVSRLNHPHVVSVFDFGQTPAAEGGLLFLVMELLTGPDLAAVVDRERHLSLPRVADITIQTLEALGEAHHLGIVHRDVKPENILLEPTRGGHDHVKVIDFGIAKVEASRRITQAGTICGTPNYMAPEQMAGKAGPSVDIYSTGVVLFEMLTGSLPFGNDAPFGGPLDAPRPDPRQVVPHRGIPSELAAACVRAMQVDPTRRFPDAQAFADAIREAMSGAGTVGTSTAREKAPAAGQRRRLADTLPVTTVMEGHSARSSHTPTSTSPSERPSTGGFPLVGRDEDLGWAFEMLSAEHAPAAIAFWGRRGVGRTRLAQEVAAVAASEGTLVVSVPLSPKPCDEVGYVGLRHIVRGLSGLSAAELMDPNAVGPLDRWSLMGLRTLFSRAKAPPEPNMARRTAAAALGWAMWRATERTERGRVLVVIDDMDRLDGASLLALRDRMQSEPIPGVTLLVTSEHARTVMLLPGVRERALRGLPREDAVRMLSAARQPAVLIRPDDDIEPLYVAQVAAVSPSEAALVPQSLEDIVSWRMQALTLGQRRVLHALAIVGVQNTENLGVLLRNPGDTDALLDSLVEGGWIERHGGQVSLRCAVYGAAAIAGAAATATAAIHNGAAHQIRNAREMCELRAFHAIHGAADFEAFLLLEDVARIRSARGDDDGAIAALSRAVTAARTQVMRGETEAASAALGVFGRKLAAALVAADRIDEAQGVLDEVLDVAGPKELTRAAVLEQLATVAELRGRTEDADRRRREALVIAERTDDQKLKDRLRDAIQSGQDLPRLKNSEPPGRRRVPTASSSTLPPQFERPPVLVVEDDRSIREGIQAVLESEGHQAFCAANGREALDLLRRIPRPGLILLDLMMPVMNGWELLEALRADDEFATIPVVVVSAVSERSKVAASRVLRKPVEVGTLISIVEELCC